MSTVPTSSPSTLAAPRLVFLDALRVLAILLVVILHAMAPVLVDTKQLGQPGWYLCMLQNPINRAGVPLFFMISGLLLLQDPAIHTPLSFYRRRLPRLLLPLAVWNGIYLLLRTHPDSFRSGFEDYFRTLLTTGSCYHMWFIYTILGIYLVAPVLGFLAQRGGRTYLMILLAAAVFPTSILPLINRVLPFQAVVYTPMAEGLLGYFILGFLLGTIEVPRPARMAVYLAGGAGYCTDLFTDLATSTAQSIPISSQNVYRLSHYFVACGAVFVGALLSPKTSPCKAGRSRASGASFPAVLRRLLGPHFTAGVHRPAAGHRLDHRFLSLRSNLSDCPSLVSADGDDIPAAVFKIAAIRDKLLSFPAY